MSLTDATPKQVEKPAGDASANAAAQCARGNMFADFLASSPEQLKPQGSTACQILHEGDKAIAGGKTAFSGLPEMPPPAAEAADKKANFAAMMAPKQTDNDIADQAMKNTLKNVD